MSLKQPLLIIISWIFEAFGYREREHSMVVNDYFGPWRKNRLHATPDYGPRKYKLEVDYYRQTYCSPEKVARIREKLEKSGQEVMYSSKCLNYNYIEFVSYETCDKLIWTSGED